MCDLSHCSRQSYNLHYGYPNHTIETACGNFIMFIVKCGNIIKPKNDSTTLYWNWITEIKKYFYPCVNFDRKFIEDVIDVYCKEKIIFNAYIKMFQGLYLYTMFTKNHPILLKRINKLAKKYHIYSGGVVGVNYTKIYRALKVNNTTTIRSYLPPPSCKVHELYIDGNTVGCNKCLIRMKICSEENHIYDHYVDDNNTSFYKCKLCNKIKDK